MPTSPESNQWRVQRVSGLLVPGFTKSFDAENPGAATAGCTSFLGVPIGRFDVVDAADGVELRYRRWPILDVLHPVEASAGASTTPHVIPATGNIRLPGDRRWRFCSFELASPS